MLVGHINCLQKNVWMSPVMSGVGACSPLSLSLSLALSPAKKHIPARMLQPSSTVNVLLSNSLKRGTLFNLCDSQYPDTTRNLDLYLPRP